jgi:hypothetical protein
LIVKECSGLHSSYHSNNRQTIKDYGNEEEARAQKKKGCTAIDE